MPTQPYYPEPTPTEPTPAEPAHSQPAHPQPALKRRLGLLDAVAIGAGSMIGAGLFAAFTPAAAAAGAGLLIGLAIAAFVAFCNATSTAQLAATYPTSGGVYVFGRKQLGPWWGYLAGWGFVVGKTASSAAMALTFAAYIAPSQWQKPVAIMAVILLTAVNYRGITRTAALTKIIVAAVLVGLAIALVSIWPALWPAGTHATGTLWGELGSSSWYGILQSAGLLFFAFAGYARIATMGEEVRNPGKTIPRAVVLALGLVTALYALVAITLLTVLGAEGMAASQMPLADAVAATAGAAAPWVQGVVKLSAALASLGALLALIAGLGRTSLAMAREGDLPTWLAAVHPTYRVPHRAEVTLGALVCVIIAVADIRGAIGFSSFGVLIYYLIANISAFTQPAHQRKYPRVLQVMGALACAVLVITLPLQSVVVGVGVFAVGIVARWGMRAWRNKARVR